MQTTPFTLHVPDEVLADLRSRIQRTRWPVPAPGAAWTQGTDLDELKRLLAYWADGFDWRAQERWLNSFRHFRTELGGVQIHFVHERARDGNDRKGIPLILTHGWPSSFLELLPLVPLLTDPKAHGIDGPAFDLVIPSLPGYGFSERPARSTYRSVARLWHVVFARSHGSARVAPPSATEVGDGHRIPGERPKAVTVPASSMPCYSTANSISSTGLVAASGSPRTCKV